MKSALQMLRQAGVIVAVGALIGTVLNALHVRGVALAHPFYAAAESGVAACSAPGHGGRISPAAAAGMCSDCTVAFVDARSASAFAQGHVAGAMHLPPVGHADEAARMAELAQKKTVVVYDDLSACNLADSVSQRLKERGVRDVRVLEGGWGAWQKQGQPAASGACETCAAHMHDGHE
jgi:rhodanese-related sulfurtransferase